MLILEFEPVVKSHLDKLFLFQVLAKCGKGHINFWKEASWATGACLFIFQIVTGSQYGPDWLWTWDDSSALASQSARITGSTSMPGTFHRFEKLSNQRQSQPMPQQILVLLSYLFLVLLLHFDQLFFEIHLYLSKMILLFKQHLLHFNTADLALIQATFKFAHLYFGGDQLKT